MRISDWSSDVCSSDLPVAVFLILLALMFVMFQAVYAWSEAPIGWIEDGIAALQGVATDALPDGFLRGLIVEGLLAGVGAVVVFLPQILILFLFILLLEASGYMTRAAFLMDGLMAKRSEEHTSELHSLMLIS